MKIIKFVIIAAATIIPLQSAHAQSGVVNAQLVFPDVDGFSDGLSIAVGYEIPVPNVHPNFSAEGELTKSISSPDSGGLDFSYYSLSGYGKYTHKVDPNFNLYGRVGLTYTSAEVDVTYLCLVGGLPSTCTSSNSDTDTSLSLGFGMDYAINPQMDFTAGFTILHKDINHLSAGIKFKL
ncbi:MAG: porin family protein [Chromatiales bacterium]|nr:porin family protein [Chromatiales bacterium]